MFNIDIFQMPMYNRSDSVLWFVICESAFALDIPKTIIESLTNYNYIVLQSPPNVTSIIEEVYSLIFFLQNFSFLEALFFSQINYVNLKLNAV